MPAYEEVKKKFQEIYWGANADGNVTKEKWLLAKSEPGRLAKRAELAIFTGRVWRELNHTLDREGVRHNFKTIVTVEEVANPKPAPDGLLKILNGRPPHDALYVGDNVDDALAAQSANVPFLGILPRSGEERRQRGTRLRTLGALAILNDISELEHGCASAQPPEFVPVPLAHLFCRIFVSTKHDTGTIVPAAASPHTCMQRRGFSPIHP